MDDRSINLLMILAGVPVFAAGMIGGVFLLAQAGRKGVLKGGKTTALLAWFSLSLGAAIPVFAFAWRAGLAPGWAAVLSVTASPLVIGLTLLFTAVQGLHPLGMRQYIIEEEWRDRSRFKIGPKTFDKL